ncbi:MAG TPA: circadian clock protein KaiC [Firmicutes bacterium]|jgi:circadian clock protein KaiC|nr:circadian clock protein KaiC [Bacillota bacterium]
MNRISTGIATLDKMLQGGFPEGSLVLLVGRPGSGKTIFVHQMMFHNATLDAKVLYLTTLAEPQIKVMKFQQEFSFFDPGKFQSSVIYQDLGYTLRKYGTVKALTTVDELIQKYQPRLLVIDTVKTIADMAASFQEFREFVLDISVRVATWGCTALFLGEYSEEDIEMRPESAIADGIVYLSGMEDKKQQKRYLRILKMRGTAYDGGEIFFKITYNGIEVFPRLNPDLSLQKYEAFPKRISTGIPQLDEMMDGGIPEASTTLLSGAAGTGKTIIATYFVYAGLQAGEPVVFVSFEEEPQQILRTAATLGADLKPYMVAGLLQFMHVSPMELDVDEHIIYIQQLVKIAGAKRLVIDSISAFEVGMRDKVKYTDYIWALTDFFKVQGISVMLTHEMHDSAQVGELTKHGISFVADNLILLRYEENGADLKRYLRIIKMRLSKHSSSLRELVIGDNKVIIGCPYR